MNPVQFITSSNTSAQKKTLPCYDKYLLLPFLSSPRLYLGTTLPNSLGLYHYFSFRKDKEKWRNHQSWSTLPRPSDGQPETHLASFPRSNFPEGFASSTLLCSVVTNKKKLMPLLHSFPYSKYDLHFPLARNSNFLHDFSIFCFILFYFL